MRAKGEGGMALRKRVVVTGVGVVSPIGIGKEEFWKRLINGDCGAGYVSRFDASSYPCNYAAEVNNFQPLDYLTPKNTRRLSRGSQFAIVSAKKAVEDSMIDLSKEDSYRVGLCYGTSVGPMDIYERFGAYFYERGLKRVSPIFEGLMNHNAIIGALAEAFNIRGFNLTVSAACSSGNMAVANGYHAVSAGIADILLAGGTDTPINPLTYGMYAASHVLAPNNGDPKTVLCPYDKRRNGYILGEGSGTLILEELEHARRRDARIYAEILGFGLTNDASDSNLFSPEPTGIIKAFQIALAHSSLRPEEMDYVCGHAHSSVVIDRKETQAIKEVFGEHAYKLAVSSIKGAVGHSMAGATSMQGIAASLALFEGMLPPTVNYEVPDPELDLYYVPKQGKKKNIQTAMANSFGLGGTNVVVVYRKFDGSEKEPMPT
jgi:3-oxoacyl-[acyl-carrier-protein] synthase II